MKRLLVHLVLCCAAAAIVYLLHRRRRWAWLLFLILGAAAVPCVWRSCEPVEWFSDFNRAYYPAGRLILQNPSALYDVDFSQSGFVNLPIVAMLFAPLSRLPLPQAQFIFFLFGISAVAGSCIALLRGTRDGWKIACVLGLFLLNGPLYYSLREGNLTHFLLPLLVVVVWCIEHRRDVVLGALLALAAVVKPPLALLVCYYLCLRRWRVLAGASATVALLVGASLLTVGVEPHWIWWRRCIQTGARDPLAVYNVQSLSAFLARLLTTDGLTRWQGVALGWQFKALYYPFLAALTLGTIAVLRRDRRTIGIEGEKIELFVILVLALLVSPISWTHYYALLLVPLSLYAVGRLEVPRGRNGTIALALAVMLISSPVFGIASHRWEMRLFASHYFLGGALLWLVLIAARRRLAASERFCEASLTRHVRLAGIYAALALVIVVTWTWFARTELFFDRLDSELPSGERYCSWYSSIIRLADGTAISPFVKRRLLPDLAQLLARAVPAEAWSALTRTIESDGRWAELMRGQIRRLNWRPEHFPLLFSATFILWCSVFGFMFACRWLVNFFYVATPRMANILGGVFGFLMLGGNGDWHYRGYPYDFPNAFVFALALAALLARQRWFVLAFAAAVWSKETSILLIFAYVLLADDRRSPRFWAMLGVLVSIYAALRGWIVVHYPSPEGDFWSLRRNMIYFGVHLVFYTWWLPIFAFGMYRFLSLWPEYPATVRRLCLLAVPLVGMAVFKGWIEEMRQYLELLPLFGMMLVQWVLHETDHAHLLRPRSDAIVPFPAARAA